MTDVKVDVDEPKLPEGSPLKADVTYAMHDIHKNGMSIIQFTPLPQNHKESVESLGGQIFFAKVDLKALGVIDVHMEGATTQNKAFKVFIKCVKKAIEKTLEKIEDMKRRKIIADVPPGFDPKKRIIL